MPDENRFVTHEYLNGRERTMYQYIDNNDNKLKELFYTLDKKLELDKQRGEQTIEQQQKMITSLDRINDNFVSFDKRVTKVEEQTVSNTSDIDTIKATTKEKNEGTIQLWIAIIGVIGTAIGGAWAFAQSFF